MTMRIFLRRALAWMPALLLTLSVTFAGLLAIRALRGPVGLERRALLRADVARVEADNAQLKSTLETLERQIVVERDRPEVQEQLIRTLLGYVRPEEHILKLGH